MKKLIYSLAFVALALVGCTTWDDAVTEKYGEGPSIAINITNTTDSAFTFTLSPAAGTLYYNYYVEEAAEADPEIEADVLLRGGYGNKENVANAVKSPTTSRTLDAEPNTTYQIYAVASNDKGIVGNVTVQSVTTSDKHAPALDEDPFEPVPDKKAVAVYFDQEVKRGTGDVSAIYYKEWDWENPVIVPTDSIEVTIDGSTVLLSAPTTPNGAIVAFSWAGGAFTDAIGNRCASFTTIYDEAKDEFIGAYVQNKKVAFEIADSCFVDACTAFKKPDEFKVVVDLGFDIYTIDDSKEAGDIRVTFENDTKSTTYKLQPEDWTVSGTKITFGLPKGIEDGDKVYVELDEGIVFDVYGNTNEYYPANDAVWWMYVTATVDDIVGAYTLKMISYFDEDKAVVDAGIVTIEASDEPNGLLLKNFWMEGHDLKAYYDLAAKTVTVPTNQLFGTYTDEEGTFGLLFTNAAADADVVFNLDLDKGTITCAGMWGIYAFDEKYEEEVGWFEVAAASMLTKNTAAARKVQMSKSKNTAKLKKGGRKIVRK